MKPKVIISGGSAGIGREIALHLTSSHEVHTFARNAVRDKRDDPRGSAIHHLEGIDVRQTENFESLDLGQFDCLVNNVGIAYDGILATQSVESIHEIISVNLTSLAILTKLYLRSRLAIRKPGVIVNVSSIISTRGYSGLAVYSATKAGIDGLTRSLAREMGAKKFRVNSVLPGYVATDLSRNLNEEQRRQITRRTPLGRLAEPDDIAPVVAFLLSEDARFITGQCLVVDGGLTC